MQGQWQVAIDLGTSNTMAVVGGPNAWVRPVTFDGRPTLSTGVFAADDGSLVVGQEAERGALRAPGRFEPNPKRRVDDGQVLLGDREYDVSWLIGAVFGTAYAQACQLARVRIPSVVLPYPVGWGQRRRAVLIASAQAARLPNPRLVAEPIAAAAHFVTSRGVNIPPGRCVLVYDLGGCTFEATVLRRGHQGFEVIATGGLSDVGGNDIDAAIVAYLRAQVRPDDDGWNRLTCPGSSVELHASRSLWEGVRSAKEHLSRASSTVVSVPILGVEAPLGREQFEKMARPILEQTIIVTMGVIADARLRPTDLAGVFPVDGSSRIPLVATMLHRAIGVAPTSIEEPHLAVALGSLVAASVQGPLQQGPATPPHGMTAPPVSGLPTSGRPMSAPPGQQPVRQPPVMPPQPTRPTQPYPRQPSRPQPVQPQPPRPQPQPARQPPPPGRQPPPYRPPQPTPPPYQPPPQPRPQPGWGPPPYVPPGFR